MDSIEIDLPNGVGNPARRALIGAGYRQLRQLATVSEDDIRHLHGIGPKAINILRRALAEQGLSFAGKNLKNETRREIK